MRRQAVVVRASDDWTSDGWTVRPRAARIAFVVRFTDLWRRMRRRVGVQAPSHSRETHMKPSTLVRAAVVLFVVFWLSSPTPARAQALSGTIAGIARDTTGAVLPGVTVEASS